MPIYNFNSSNTDSPSQHIVRGTNHSNPNNSFVTAPGNVMAGTVGFLSETEFFCLCDNGWGAGDIYYARGWKTSTLNEWHLDTVGKWNVTTGNSFNVSVISSPVIYAIYGAVIVNGLLAMWVRNGQNDYTFSKLLFFKVNSGHSHPTYLGESEPFWLNLVTAVASLWVDNAKKLERLL